MNQDNRTMQPSNAATAGPENPAVLESKVSRGKHPNSRKKSSERKLKRFNRVLFEDQEGVTSERLRELIDLYGA